MCEPSTARLVQSLLQLSATQARGRVAAAEELGPRRELTGAPLPPLFPVVAAAQAAGTICERRARAITQAVGNLPAVVQFRHAEAVEAFLVEQAPGFDACALAGIARRLSDTLDPDGTLTEAADHHRRRQVRLRARPDGSGELSGHLTASCLAHLQAILDPLAAPSPAADGRADPRSAGQRQHDAVEAVARRLLRSDTLPTSGGTPATVLLTMTISDLQSRTGYATTGHGGLIDLPTALRMATEACVIPVFMNDTGGIIASGRGRRTASPSQRHALAARDGGCTFPSCTTPPEWCDVHHLRNWATGGNTDLTNLALLCGYHHDHHRQTGWECHMIDRVPTLD
ncbi:MAG: HNH endonuclease, partial [Actinomycetota bacterium]|nr:HNH endonuclease [Actinomycetota bacterium]